MAVIVLMLSVGSQVRVFRAFNMSIAYLAVALLINYVVEHPVNWVGRMLNHRAVVWIGALSYSLYIWQQLAFTIFSWASVAVAVAFLWAAISYYQVEMPCNSMRKRWI